MAKKSTGDGAPVEQSETVIKAKRQTRVTQPKTKIKTKQSTRVAERVTVIQKEQPQGTKWLGVNPWILIGGGIAVLLLVFLPVFPAEKTVDKTETVMVPVTKMRDEQVTADETIKTYQGYMVQQRGGEPGMGTVTTTGPYWSGTWQAGGIGIMTTTQNGNQVTAVITTLSDGSKTQFTGTVSGYQCTGWWSEIGGAGDMEFTLATDGQSMTCRYREVSSSIWKTVLFTRTGPGVSTGTVITDTGTGTIAIDAVAEIVDVLRAAGQDNTQTLTLTAHDGSQVIYRNIVRDDLTKTGKATVSVTKTVSKPYTEQVPKEVIKQEIVKFRVNLLSMIMQDY